MDLMHVAELVVTQLFAAGVAYGAIRMDLRNLRDGVKEAKDTATRAHQRLDTHLETSHS